MTEDNNRADLIAYARQLHKQTNSSLYNDRVLRLFTLYCEANNIPYSLELHERITTGVVEVLDAICRKGDLVEFSDKEILECIASLVNRT